MPTQSEKEFLNLSGEFRVASELLRRNIICSITYGNSKSVDIILFNHETKSLKIVEVKTTSSSNSFITSFYQKYKSSQGKAPDYWVLYYQDKIDSRNDKFFILTHEELSLEQAKRNRSTSKTWEKRAEGKGVDNLLIKDISLYLNKWEKIEI